MIKARSLSQQSEKPDGLGWLFWQETFQLCRDVPLLLDEIERLKSELETLKGCV